MSDLVERLGWHREEPQTGEFIRINPDGPEAADRIAQLEAEVARLRGALLRCRDASDGWDLDMCNYHAFKALQGAADAE